MYNKLFTKILDSSIWLEPTPTRIVWLTMIAAMDEAGYVQFASVPNLAHRARVTVAEAQEAVGCLEAPDQNSSDPDNEGRRIERVPGGWVVLNSEKYRELVKRALVQEQTRVRVAKHREEQRLRNADVTQVKRSVTPSETETETETEAFHPPLPPASPSKWGISEGKNSDRVPTTEQSKRIATLFRRRLTTAWSEAEVKAYRKLGVIPDEDLLAMERYYASERAKGDDGRHRRDLATFLNNFSGELDRALQAIARKPRNGLSFGVAGERKVVPVDPSSLPPLTAEEEIEGAKYKARLEQLRAERVEKTA